MRGSIGLLRPVGRGAALARSAVLALLLAGPVNAAGRGVTLGVGVMSGRASSDALVEDATRAGWEVTAGYRAWERVTVEFIAAAIGRKIATEETAEIYYPRDEAEVGMFGLGVRLDLLRLAEVRWTPWIGGGLGYTMLDWQTFAYWQAGAAPYLTFGVDVEPRSGLIVRGRLASISAATHDPYDHATPRASMTTLSLAVAYEFGRRRLPPRDRDAPVSVPPPARPSAAPGPDPDAPPAPAAEPPPPSTPAPPPTPEPPAWSTGAPSPVAGAGFASPARAEPAAEPADSDGTRTNGREPSPRPC